MIEHGSSLKDYFGYYSKTQNEFKLICGEVKIISNIARECQKLYETTQKAKSNEGDISDNVKLLFANVDQWMKSQRKLQKALEQELYFKVKKSSLVVKSDGSISVLIKCPIKECVDGFKATYKGYRRQNQQKKSSKEGGNSKNSITPRWHYASLRQHLFKSHCSDDDDMNNNNNIDSDSKISESELSSIENQVRSQNRAREVPNEKHTDETHSISNSQKSDYPISRKQIQAVVRMKLRARDAQPPKTNKRQRNQ